MHWLQRFWDWLKAFWSSAIPVFKAIGRFFVVLGKSLYTIGVYLFRLRGIILAAPVAAATVIIASINMDRLPDTLDMTKISFNAEAENALFGFLEISSVTISRELAVLGPVVLTGVCLVMMLLSKRTLYPFLISLFTLCLPFALYFFHIYPM